VSLEFDTAQPLAYGMPARAAGFFAGGSAYDVPQDGSVTTVARYAAKDVLVSGLLQGESTIAGRPAIVSAAVGSGRVILFGVRVQHRGQSYATFRLLFNAIFTSR
jgi:glutamine amidotransferase-like uncharacterized protein